jgi:hypothetical protein
MRIMTMIEGLGNPQDDGAVPGRELDHNLNNSEKFMPPPDFV